MRAMYEVINESLREIYECDLTTFEFILNDLFGDIEDAPIDQFVRAVSHLSRKSSVPIDEFELFFNIKVNVIKS